MIRDQPEFLAVAPVGLARQGDAAVGAILCVCSHNPTRRSNERSAAGAILRNFRGDCLFVGTDHAEARGVWRMRRLFQVAIFIPSRTRRVHYKRAGSENERFRGTAAWTRSGRFAYRKHNEGPWRSWRIGHLNRPGVDLGRIAACAFLSDRLPVSNVEIAEWSGPLPARRMADVLPRFPRS